MFWTVFFTFIFGYAVIGLVCVPTLTRDAYRRSKLKNTGHTEEQHLMESSGQAWADALFWPVYMVMHFSLTLLEKDSKAALEEERTKRYLEEATEAPKSDWLTRFSQAEMDAKKRNNLKDEGG
jgi:hypothetical protein